MRPFAQCSMDMITDLPISNGFDSILAVVDHSLKKGAIWTNGQDYFQLRTTIFSNFKSSLNNFAVNCGP